MHASMLGNLPVVRFLLEHKANVEAKDHNGAFSNSALCAHRFLILKCVVNVKLFPGSTPLIYASHDGHLPVVM